MSFTQEIEELSGQRVNLCFQCSKCSSGCPLADWMDIKPAQVVHNIRLGREQVVLNSTAIWYCVGCEACTARCPQGLEPAALMSAARILAVRKGIQPQVREVAIYYRCFVDNMRLNGKIHDASVAGITQLLTGQLRENLPLAWELFVRGRVRPPTLPFGGRSFRKLYNDIVEKERRPGRI